MKKKINFKTIRSKMLFGFTLVLLLIFALSFYNYIVLMKVNKKTEEVLEDELPVLVANEQLIASLYNKMGVTLGYLLTGDDIYKDIFTKEVEKTKDYQAIVNNIDTSLEFSEITQKTNEWNDYLFDEVFGTYDKGDKDLAYENLKGADDNTGILLEKYNEFALNKENHIITLENDILEDGKRTIIIVSIISFFVILLSLIIAIITSNTISKPIKMIMKRMKDITEGDLSGKPLETDLNDEVGQLITSTNEMKITIHNLLIQIDEVTNTVANQSEELTRVIGEVKTGTEQIYIAMNELTIGSESQANNTINLTVGMESFTSQVEDAAGDGEQVQKSSKNVLGLTQKGLKLMSFSINQMEAIDEIVQESVSRVEGLDVHTQKISELVSVIREIADQTNLLALNAAIEAARAGEHGQGFAVVAEEVRKLAEQSSMSVMNITDIVDNIQSESSEVASSLRMSYKEVESGKSQMIVTGDTFENISSATSEMVTNIQGVSCNLANISAKNQKINESIQDIAAISEESAASAEETTASTEQITGAMKELTESSNGLTKLSEELNGLLSKFRL